jgi:lysozyme
MNDDLIYDAEGMDLTEDAEGCVLTAYPDPGTGAEPWTIGYGHTGPDVRPGMTITMDDAADLLRDDIRKAEAQVKRLVQVQLNQHQYDALVDFEFNTGRLATSTMLRLVNAGDMAGADNEFQKWVYAAGHVLPGLVKRRHAEAVIFAEA